MTKKLKRRLIYLCVLCFIFLASLLLFMLVDPNKYIKMVVYLTIYLLVGYRIIIKAVTNVFKGRVLDENFLMVIASVGALIVGEFSEGVAVMLFFEVGQWFEKFAVGKSRNSIKSLMDICPDRAVILKDGKEVEVDPLEIEIGDILVVKNGEKIAVDGQITKGISSLNTAMLTGESLPKDVKQGDNVLSGCINLGGVLEIKALKLYQDSTVSRILDLVENASDKKSKSEDFISKFARFYTPFVVISAVLLALIPPLFFGNFTVWLMRALTFLVVSCPCALVISIPLSFFGGIGGASKLGILVKGSNYLERLEKVNTFVFDKTGTLTKGQFEVVEVFPKDKQEEVLRWACVCESKSNHPIAKCIAYFYNKEVPSGYAVEEISGKGMIAKNEDNVVLVGNALLMKDNKVEFIENGSIGSVVYVALNNEFLGSVVVADTLKESTKEAIEFLNSRNKKTIMLSGDNEKVAKSIAKELNLYDYKAELLPDQKVEKLDEIIKANTKGEVAFVGDGINDAPALMRADIGISMGNVGSDSAIESSDVVLMFDDLKQIISAIKVSKKTNRIVRQNIALALGVKFSVLLLSALGFANMWLAIFADVGVAVIAILNAMRVLMVKK